MRSTISLRRVSGSTTVLIGVRPGGSSSMTETSRSAYAVMASVRGIGVAVITSWCGNRPSDRPFLAQLQALVHAEAVLLVDDRQREALERDVLLEQRVRADGDLDRARREVGFECRAHFAGLPAGQQRDSNAERFQPRVEVARVLLGEQFRRRHHGRLCAVLHRTHRGQRGDHRLARADVALHQSHHRMRPLEILRDLGPHARWAPVSLKGRLARQRSARSLLRGNGHAASLSVSCRSSRRLS